MYLGGRGVGRGWAGLGCAGGSAIGRTADGRKHKSNNIVFPDQWATSRFNYFFSHPIFSFLLSLFSSYLPPHLPPKKIRSVGGFRLFYNPSIMEDGVSWSGSDWPVQEMGLVNETRGRTDVTEPDMWRHTALRVQALGCACNTCFPYCLFIASWTSQSIGKNTEKKNKGRRLLFLLLGDISVP